MLFSDTMSGENYRDSWCDVANCVISCRGAVKGLNNSVCLFELTYSVHG